MTQTPEIGATEYLRARASVARTLVAEGKVSPESALFYAVWPSKEIAEVERKVNRFTIASRAYSKRANP